MNKFFGIIALSIIAGLTIASCDLDSIVGTGDYECKFVNVSSYDVTVYNAKSSTFSTFTVKSGKTTTLKTDDYYIYFNYSDKDKVDVYVSDVRGVDYIYISSWGENRVVFRNITP